MEVWTAKEWLSRRVTNNHTLNQILYGLFIQELQKRPDSKAYERWLEVTQPAEGSHGPGSDLKRLLSKDVKQLYSPARLPVVFLLPNHCGVSY